MKKRTTFSSVAAARKNTRLMKVFLYFHDALAEVGQVIDAGQAQHQTSGWDRCKSGDELEALLRHVVDAGYLDSDDLPHSAKVAWRALANLQKELEAERGLPISAGSYDPRQPADADDCTLDNACQFFVQGRT